MIKLWTVFTNLKKHS